jgi:2-polyprenyl-3-methyl-5-hydroxy-6-metoxy-1,4-benzoquinol methylase
MDVSHETQFLPCLDEVREISQLEWPPNGIVGWRPLLRERYGYYQPEHYYEAVVAKLVTPGCCWLDVGGGKSIFPMSPRLSRQLAERAGRVAGVDPDENLRQNPFVRECFIGPIEEYRSDQPFDIATLRMVAEHISDPEAAVQSLARLIRPAGLVVIFTPYRWSPVSVVSSIVPNRWHARVTGYFWGTHDEDVFPTCYKMNTRSALSRWFASSGFREVLFRHLDNCQVFQRWKLASRLELMTWRVLNAMGVHYPETELLAIYQRVA